MIRYVWELFVDDEWMAGGECPDEAPARNEMNRYAAEYAEEGEVETHLYRQEEIT